MFQCYPLKSSRPLLPLSPKVCSLHPSRLCCPVCMIIGTILLDSIYMSFLDRVHCSFSLSFLFYTHRLPEIETIIFLKADMRWDNMPRLEIRRERKRDTPNQDAATAKSLQSYPTLRDPTDGSPPGSLVPGILQERTLEWVAISFSMHESEKWKWSRLVVSNPLWPHGLQPTRLLHPWGFPAKSTGMGCHCLLCNQDESWSCKIYWAPCKMKM